MARTVVDDANSSVYNGTNGSLYVTLPQGSGLPLYNTTTGYSVAGTFKLGKANPLSDYTVWSEGNSGVTTQFLVIDTIGSGLGGFRVRLVNNAGGVLINSVTSTTKLTPGRFYDFVWVDVAGTCTLYVNGVADASNFSYTPSGAFTLNLSTIGSLGRTTYANNMVGNLSNYQLFDYGLTAAQVQQVRAGSLSGNVRSYPLDEGVGSIAYDVSDNASNGTIVTGAWTNDTPSKTRKSVGGNLVYNGDFEYAPVVNIPTTTQFRWIDGTAAGNTVPTVIFGWGLEALSGTGSAGFDSSEKYSGSYSMKLSSAAVSTTVTVSPKANSSFINSTVPVLPSTSYTVTARIKTNITSGTATTGAQIKASQLSGNNTTEVTGTVVIDGIITTQGWTSYTSTFTTSATTRFIKMQLRLVNDGAATLVGDAWFDDITLTKTTPETRTAVSYPSRKALGHNLVLNGDFEYAPAFTAATTTAARFIDGTAGGSTTNASYGWAMGKSGTVAAQFDTSVSHSGTTSMKLSTTATASYIECYNPNVANGISAYFGKVINIRPMTSYTYSFWMKTNLVSGTATNGAFATLVFSDASGASNGGCTASISNTAVKTTQDWTRYTGTFTTTAVDAYVQIDLKVYGHQGAGTLIMDAWFDDVSLTLTTPPSRSAA
jgi:hypothetical protein